jgi:hypothetical protein
MQAVYSRLLFAFGLPVLHITVAHTLPISTAIILNSPFHPIPLNSEIHT